MNSATTFRRTARGYDIYHHGRIVGGLYRASRYDRHAGRTMPGGAGWDIELDCDGRYRELAAASFKDAKLLAAATLLAFDITDSKTTLMKETTP